MSSDGDVVISGFGAERSSGERAGGVDPDGAALGVAVVVSTGAIGGAAISIDRAVARARNYREGVGCS